MAERHLSLRTVCLRARDEEFCSGNRIVLDDAKARHLLTVLRLESGTAVRLTNGQGHAWDAVLGVDGKAVTLILGEPLATSVEQRQIVIFQGIAKNPTMDSIVEKMGELGVYALVPVILSRSVVRPSASEFDKYTRRWN